MPRIVVVDSSYSPERWNGFPSGLTIEYYKEKYGMSDFCRNKELDKSSKNTEPFIAFLHKNNVDANWTTPLEKAVGWPKNFRLIEYCSLRICKYGGRVAIVSGGRPEIENFEKNLLDASNNEYKRGIYWDFVRIEEIDKQHKDLLLPAISADWRIDTINTGAKPISDELSNIYSLLPFDLFLQAALAAHFSQTYSPGAKLFSKKFKELLPESPEKEKTFEENLRAKVKELIGDRDINELLRNNHDWEHTAFSDVLETLNSADSSALDYNLIAEAHKEFAVMVKKKPWKSLKRQDLY